MTVLKRSISFPFLSRGSIIGPVIRARQKQNAMYGTCFLGLITSIIGVTDEVVVVDPSQNVHFDVVEELSFVLRSSETFILFSFKLYCLHLVFIHHNALLSRGFIMRDVNSTRKMPTEEKMHKQKQNAMYSICFFEESRRVGSSL